MPQQIFGLTGADVTTLRQVVAAWRSGDLGRPQQPQRRTLPPRSSVVFGLLESSVDATTALTGPPKSGSLNIYKFTSTGGTSDTGIDATVWNFAPQAATTDRWTFCVREHFTGKLLIDFQACS